MRIRLVTLGALTIAVGIVIAADRVFSEAAEARNVVSSVGDAYYYDTVANVVEPVVENYQVPESAVLCLEAGASVSLDTTGEARVLLLLTGPLIWTMDREYFQRGVEEKYSEYAKEVNGKVVITPPGSLSNMRQQLTKVREGVVKVTMLFKDDKGNEKTLFSAEVKGGQQAVVSPCGVVSVEAFDVSAQGQEGVQSKEETVKEEAGETTGGDETGGDEIGDDVAIDVTIGDDTDEPPTDL